MKNKKNIYDLVKFCLLILFITQMCWLFYINIFNLRYYMEYDSSANLLHIIETWKQKKLILNNFEYTTTTFFRPDVALLYGLTENIYLAQGIGNIIFIILYLVLSNVILRELTYNKNSFLSSLLLSNVIICPFINVSNCDVSNYFIMTLGLVAYYGYMIIISLFTVYILLCLNNRDSIKKKDYVFIAVFLLILLFYSAYSSLYLTVILLFPLLIYSVIVSILENSFTVLKSKPSIFIYACILISLTGNIIYNKRVSFQGKDLEMKWCGFTDLANNIFSTLTGYFDLISVLPEKTEINAVSMAGLSYLAGLVIAIAIISAVCYLLRKLKFEYNNYKNILPLLCVIIFDTIIYCLLYTRYAEGGDVFASRYLIVALMFLFILLSLYCNELDDKLVLKKLGIITITIAIVFLTVSSDYYYSKIKQDNSRLDSIQELIQQGVNVDLVYFIDGQYDDCRRLRVDDTSRIYKNIWGGTDLHHWGDYTYNDEAGEYQGPYMIFCNKESIDLIPAYVKSKIKLIQEWDIYNIYYGEGTVYDFKTDYNSRYSLDFPYSPSVTVNHMSMNERGEYISDGTNDFIVYGPSFNYEAGKYNITLEYEILSAVSDDVAVFDLVLNEENIVDSIMIHNDSKITSVSFSGITFDDNDNYLQYRVFEADGTIMHIKRIIIEKE